LLRLLISAKVVLTLGLYAVTLRGVKVYGNQL